MNANICAGANRMARYRFIRADYALKNLCSEGCSVRTDTFGDGNGDFLADHEDFCAGDGAVVGQNPDVVLGRGFEIDHSAAAHFQELTNWHSCSAENDTNLDGNFFNGTQLNLTLLSLTVVP